LIIDFFLHEENYNSAFDVKNLILIDTLSKLDYFKLSLFCLFSLWCLKPINFISR